jgi:hypothetical protein
MFPDIAAEAYGWDPSTVTQKSNQKKEWKCNLGHIYACIVYKRTVCGHSCPFCSGRRALKGFNDLRTKYPEVASEAFRWDPTRFTHGSDSQMEWICEYGHQWRSTISSRTCGGNGCPICTGRQVLKGFNDLQTKFPDIAAEAYGWDPTTVTPGSAQKMDFICHYGHRWKSSVSHRTTNQSGCPICSGQQLLAGFNDLQTKFPDVAKDAYGWDPLTVTSRTHKKKDWKCSFGHIWNASVASRSGGSGCPVCAEYGFNPEKDAWFYLMQRPGEQQLGITNELDVRLKTHRRNGWDLLDHTEPASGQKVLDTENAFKKWLKKEIGLMEGTTENWSTTSMEVQSLAELKARSGIETDLF